MKNEKRKEVVVEYILEHQKDLYRIAYTYTKNEQDALDVIQEAIYKALESTYTLNDKEAVRTWMYRIVVNTAIDFIRKNKKYLYVEEETLISSGDIQYDHYQNTDLKEALSHLKADERLLVSLRYFEDMKIEDVAQVMGINVNTTKTRLYKCLKKLKIDIE